MEAVGGYTRINHDSSSRNWIATVAAATHDGLTPARVGRRLALPEAGVPRQLAVADLVIHLGNVPCVVIRCLSYKQLVVNITKKGGRFAANSWLSGLFPGLRGAEFPLQRNRERGRN